MLLELRNEQSSSGTEIRLSLRLSTSLIVASLKIR